MIRLSRAVVARGLALAALCAASGGAGALLAVQTSHRNAPAMVTIAPKGHLGWLPPCGSGNGYVATLGVLAPGHSANELAAAGVLSAPAFLGTSSDILVLYPKDRNAPFGPTVSSPALQSSLPLRPQTSDPSLRSCAYDLHDNASATSIAAASIAQMVSHNLMDQSNLATSPLPVEMLTDNPYDSSQLLFILALTTPPTSRVAGDVNARESLVAFVDRTTRDVSGIAIANLFPR